AATVFLPIIDDFRRAIESIQNSKRISKQEVLDGILLLFRKLQHALRQLEIEGFESKGQRFAAELMEAIVQVPTREQLPGTVVEELEAGFLRRGKLLRPARVAVAVAAPEVTSDSEDQR